MVCRARNQRDDSQEFTFVNDCVASRASDIAMCTIFDGRGVRGKRKNYAKTGKIQYKMFDLKF